jgi:hypothetical protein
MGCYLLFKNSGVIDATFTKIAFEYRTILSRFKVELKMDVVRESGAQGGFFEEGQNNVLLSL